MVITLIFRYDSNLIVWKWYDMWYDILIVSNDVSKGDASKFSGGGKVINGEKYNLEFKEIVSNTFLKTVSAYSNYNNGKIIFGVNDNGEVVGVESIKETMLRIENMINDSIDPRPSYKLKVEIIEELNLIILEVMHGVDTPYYYKGKAYKRSDTSTVPVDRQELNRLVLDGMNLDFENNKANNQDLEFKVLEETLKETIGIEKLSIDILKTLNLYHIDGYFNIAAELLSDYNKISLSGIDIIKFGANINTILHRETFEGISILEQYEKAIEIFERYYQFEEISGYSRIRKELIPKEAFREAIANGLVHREWDLNSHIQISMYDNRIEINSPGGLPFGMSEEAYLHEQVSNLRNPIIANVFNRLNIIERFGTGVRRIKEEYVSSFSNPEFKITENNIKVILPLFEEELPDLVEEEMLVYKVLQSEDSMSRVGIEKETGFERSKVLRSMKELINKGLVERIGSGPSTSYKLK